MTPDPDALKILFTCGGVFALPLAVVYMLLVRRGSGEGNRWMLAVLVIIAVVLAASALPGWMENQL